MLISNAHDACRRTNRIPETEDSIQQVQQLNGYAQLHITMSDSGDGIAAKYLTRAFNHGFNTEIGGKGFKLHNSANLASMLGGRLPPESEGVNVGGLLFDRSYRPKHPPRP